VALGQEGERCEFGVDTNKLNDYRLRDSTERSRWAIQDVKKNHLDPAIRAMSQGHYTRSVRGDIAFILNWHPNHLPALKALIDYDAAGGKQYDLRSTECYFQLARRFAPDDVNIPLYEGYYYWTMGKLDLAEQSYKTALVLDPEFAEAHYDLGLLYASKKDYATAVEHARVAYQLGYPLPGLRRKLASAGYRLELPN
jgi:tetratricopeptide (TPR) repeat protein